MLYTHTEAFKDDTSGKASKVYTTLFLRSITVKYKLTLAVLLLSLSMLFAGGQGEEASSVDGSKLSVVTTTGMIGDAVENIGGDLVSVVSLMGPGIDPHLYKASAGDVQKLSTADIILYNGLHLEAKMGEVLEQMSERQPVFGVAEQLDKTKLLAADDDYEGYDPHVWFDVVLWKEVVTNVKDALISVDSENRSVYEANYREYSMKLDELQDYVVETLSEIPESRRVLITAHDAFGYFGNAYGFEVKGLQGISTVSEAGTKDVQDLADFIAENEIPAIFIESSVPRKNVEALQAAVESRGYNVLIGGELYSDAMGETGTVEGTYLGMVRHNISTISGAFK